MAADVCVVEHLHPTEAYDTPQVQHNDMVLHLNDPVLGPVSQIAPAAKFSSSTQVVRTPAPRIGEHNDEVLANAAGWQERADPAPSPRNAGALLEGVRILDVGGISRVPIRHVCWRTSGRT